MPCASTFLESARPRAREGRSGSSFRAGIYLSWSKAMNNKVKTLILLLLPILFPVIIQLLTNVRTLDKPLQPRIEIDPISRCSVFDSTGTVVEGGSCVTLAYAPAGDAFVEAVVAEIASASSLDASDIRAFVDEQSLRDAASQSYLKEDPSFLPFDTGLVFSVERAGTGEITAIDVTLFHNETVAVGAFKFNTGQDPIAQLANMEHQFSGEALQLQVQVNRALFRVLTGVDLDVTLHPYNEINTIETLKPSLMWDSIAVLLLVAIPAFLAISSVQQTRVTKGNSLLLLGFNPTGFVIAALVFFMVFGSISVLLFMASAYAARMPLTADVSFGFLWLQLELLLFAHIAISVFVASVCPKIPLTILIALCITIFAPFVESSLISIAPTIPYDPSLPVAKVMFYLKLLFPPLVWTDLFAEQATITDPFVPFAVAGDSELTSVLFLEETHVGEPGWACKTPVVDGPDCYTDAAAVDYGLGIDEFYYPDAAPSDEGDASTLRMKCYFTDCFGYHSEENICIIPYSTDVGTGETITCTFTLPLMWHSLAQLLAQGVVFTALSLYFAFILPVKGARGVPFYFPFDKAFWAARKVRAKLWAFQTGPGLAIQASPRPILELRDVSYTYQKNCKNLTHALQGVDALFFAGSCTGLIGLNGAGKTTLFNVVTGRLPTTRVCGTVVLRVPGPNTFEIDLLGPYAAYATRGFVAHALQTDEIIWSSLTVKQNVMLSYFANAGLYDAVSSLHGAETFNRVTFSQAGPRHAAALSSQICHDMLAASELSEKELSKANHLSGGMKRRLASIMSLTGYPLLALLDEPTTGLDPNSRHTLGKILERHYARGCSTILCSHDMEEVEKLCTHIIALRNGTVIANGSIEALILGDNPQLLQVSPKETGFDTVPLLRDLIRQAEAPAVIERVWKGRVNLSVDLNDPRTSELLNRILTSPILKPPRLHRRSLEDFFLQLNRAETDSAEPSAGAGSESSSSGYSMDNGDEELSSSVSLNTPLFTGTSPPHAFAPQEPEEPRIAEQNGRSMLKLMILFNYKLQGHNIVFVLLENLLLFVISIISLIIIAVLIPKDYSASSIEAEYATLYDSCTACCRAETGQQDDNMALEACANQMPSACFEYRSPMDGPRAEDVLNIQFILEHPPCTELFRLDDTPVYKDIHTPTVSAATPSFLQTPTTYFHQGRYSFALFNAQGVPLDGEVVGFLDNAGITEADMATGCAADVLETPDDPCFLAKFSNSNDAALLLSHFPNTLTTTLDSWYDDSSGYCALEYVLEGEDAMNQCLQDKEAEHATAYPGSPADALVFAQQYQHDSSLFESLEDLCDAHTTVQKELGYSLTANTKSSLVKAMDQYASVSPIAGVIYDPSAAETVFEVHLSFPGLLLPTASSFPHMEALLNSVKDLNSTMTFPGQTVWNSGVIDTPTRVFVYSDLIQRLSLAELRRRIASDPAAGTFAALPSLTVSVGSEPLPYAVTAPPSSAYNPFLHLTGLFILIIKLFTAIPIVQTFTRYFGGHLEFLKLNGLRHKTYLLSILAYHLVFMIIQDVVLVLIGSFLDMDLFHPLGTGSVGLAVGNFFFILVVLLLSFPSVPLALIGGTFGKTQNTAIMITNLLFQLTFQSEQIFLALAPRTIGGVPAAYMSFVIPTFGFAQVLFLLSLREEGWLTYRNAMIKRGEPFVISSTRSISLMSLFNGSDLCIVFWGQLVNTVAVAALLILVQVLLARTRKVRVAPTEKATPAPSISTARVPEDPAPLKVRRLQKSFADFPVLRGVDATVAENTLAVLIGRNGSGKTTLINCVIRKEIPDAGMVSSAGTVISSSTGGVGLRQMFNFVGLCPQHSVLSAAITVRQYMEFVSRIRGLSTRETHAHLTYLGDVLGMNDFYHKKVAELSGGMSRRLSIALAFSKLAKVVIADEPTTGLDPQTRRKVWVAFDELRTRIPVLITTHSMLEAEELGDSLIVLRDGKIVYDGHPDEIRSEHAERYYMTAALRPNATLDDVSRELARAAVDFEPLGECDGVAQLHVTVPLERFVATIEDLRVALVEQELCVSFSLSGETLADLFHILCSEAPAPPRPAAAAK
eukprot:gnl/Chilomastix_cuspidata/669.p1 GENE.gnl/Chilomastix_cuspidata/669~~gnl/Chilomastix_cuspidata/669.p1  ORF type:complete len:2072 (+),score=527.66 gnl/Chilomastix_cuspidata/669:34-6249(+)